MERQSEKSMQMELTFLRGEKSWRPRNAGNIDSLVTVATNQFCLFRFPANCLSVPTSPTIYHLFPANCLSVPTSPTIYPYSRPTVSPSRHLRPSTPIPGQLSLRPDISDHLPLFQANCLSVPTSPTIYHLFQANYFFILISQTTNGSTVHGPEHLPPMVPLSTANCFSVPIFQTVYHQWFQYPWPSVSLSR